MGRAPQGSQGTAAAGCTCTHRWGSGAGPLEGLAFTAVTVPWARDTQSSTSLLVKCEADGAIASGVPSPSLENAVRGCGQEALQP